MSGSRQVTTRSGRVGLALAGGGFLGAAYELGALCALAEAIDGLDLTRLDSYVGVSAGSFIAAGLVNGLSAHRMMRMFVEADDAESAFEPSKLLVPATGEWQRTLRLAPACIGASLREALDGSWRAPQEALWRSIERSLRLLPDGLVDGTPAERRLARLFSRKGRTNDFRHTRAALRIVATDIDSGESVAFGSPGREQVPISRAAVASCAVPGLFTPVRIDGRHYVDGALNKTLHASVALDQGAGLVLCINPLVPYDGAGAGSPRVSGSGMGTILAQTMRTAIRSRMSVGLAKYQVTHPQSDLVLFEPARDDVEFFFSSIFSVSSRSRLCERAYRSTRADLLARRSELDPVLRRHGLSINEAVLRYPVPRLVRAPTPPATARATRGASTLRRLGRTLDDLDRAMSVLRARRSQAATRAVRRSNREPRPL